MPVTFTVLDFGFDATRDRLEQLDGARVEIGVFDAENAKKGAINEFGSAVAGIPARPWLSVAADSGSQRLGQAMGQAVGNVADGDKPEQQLERVGLLGQNITRDVIVTGQVGGPPLAASTVARKKSAKKLVEDGDLVRAIDYEVDL